MRTLLFVVVFSCATNLLAQESSNPLSVQIIPPPPEAVALGKYIEMPVSPYTGIPNVEIPLFTLKSYELSLPIGLSYHASGIKVEELSSFVGAGWSLNAGGMVSRTIRGLNDEYPDYGYFSTTSINDFNVSAFFTASGGVNHNYFSNNVKLPNSGICVTPPLTTSPAYVNILRAARGGLDLEPDLFNFSLPDGQSGKFVYRRDKSRYMISKQYADITYTNAANGTAFDKWTIKGLDGTRYIFEDIEKTQSSSECSLKPFYSITGETMGTAIPVVDAPSSWRNTMIISASGKDTIRFTYENEVLVYEINTSLTTYDDFSHTFPVPAPNTCASQMTSTTKRLKTISTSAGYEAEFVSTTVREDIQGGKMLDKVILRYKGVEIKSFVLTHSYEGSTVPGGTYNTKILMLNQIREMRGVNGLPPYVFTYYPQLMSNYSRANPNVDHWGYSNGVTDNTSKSPAVIYESTLLSGANRDANLDYCKQWSLKEIKYPTGGTTTYEYELHDYSNIPPATATFKVIPGLEPLAKIDFAITSNVNQDYTDTKNFTLTGNTNVVFVYTIPEIPGGGIPASGCNGTLVRSSPLNTWNFVTTGPTNPPIEVLSAGTYTLSASFDPSQFNWQGIDLSTLKFSVHVYRVRSMEELAQTNSLKGGGLRIKQIKSVGDQTFTKTLAYNKPGTAISSGKLASFPSYAYFQNFDDGYMSWERCLGCCVIDHFGTIIVRTATSNYPQMMNQGSYVGYDAVTEYNGTFASNSGYSVYQYINEPEQFSDQVNLPIAPKVTFNYRNGFLTEKTDYTTAGKPVQKTLNTYTLTNLENDITGIKVTQFLTTGCQYCENRVFSYTYYTHPTELIRLAKTVTRVYDTQNDHFDESQSIYTYDAYDQVSRIEQPAAASGKNLYTRMSYNTTNHRAVEEKVSYYSVDGNSPYNFKSGQFTTYSGTYLKPQVVSLMETNAVSSTLSSPPFAARLQYDSYDSRGNVTSYHKIDDAVRVSLIWGYKQLFPIAEFTHATPDRVAFTSFENANEGGWTYTTASINGTTKRTGAKGYSLTGNPVTTTVTGLTPATYIVSYWATTSGVTITTLTGTIGTITNAKEPLVRGSWTLYTKSIPVLTGNATIRLSGTAVVDDVRIYPEGAMVRSFTYDPVNGLTSQTDTNGTTTFYSYDVLGRPEYIRDENNYILKRFEYHYAADN